jgi:sec-independent protein translocase protein TatB
VFNDVGVLEIVTLVVLAVIVFGPEKLPKMIQDASRVIRKIREFSESAKQDIRTELGPEFKDFEFEDLNPKTFVRKQLMDNDDLGLKELRDTFDLRKEMSEVADAVHSRDTAVTTPDTSAAPLAPANGSAAPSTTPDLLKKAEKPHPGELPPFDADAT